MKTIYKLHLLRFPVMGHNHRTGKEEEITVTLDKSQLRAAGLVGQSSKELITRLCERQGYTVLEIGPADRRTVTLDLGGLFGDGDSV